MIACQLKYRTQEFERLGYEKVHPPFNHNYTSMHVTEEEEDREENMKYGK